jgi:hypothetical protein
MQKIPWSCYFDNRGHEVPVEVRSSHGQFCSLKGEKGYQIVTCQVLSQFIPFSILRLKTVDMSQAIKFHTAITLALVSKHGFHQVRPYMQQFAILSATGVEVLLAQKREQSLG